MNLRKIKKLALNMCSLGLSLFWLLLIFNVRQEFYARANIDPLAMINVLFPYFWFILLGFALLCFAVLYFEPTTKWLHVILLIQLSLVLYYTPFLLSDFSWSPDSLWHGGVANQIPEVLSGSNLTISAYAKSYPFSFINTYSIEQILGVDVFIYTLYLYPLACIVAISTLAYIFASRFLNPKMAFLAMLLALAALHFIEPHVSPFSLGTIFVLMSLFLLTINCKVVRALSFFVIFILNFVHPISPISLGIFLTAVILDGYIHKKLYQFPSLTPISKTASVSLLLFLGIVWLAWTIFQSMATYIGVRNAVLNVVNLSFFRRLIYVSEWTTSGQSFVYSYISRLNLVVYAAFLLLVLVLTLTDLRKIVKERKRHSLMNYIPYKRMMMAIASILFAMFSYMLFLASGEHVLLGRGLFFFVLAGSTCISSYFVQEFGRERALRKIFTFGMFLFLLFSFPIISYSKEAYNSYTRSADAGLTFFSKNADFSKYSISMGADQQIVSYSNLSRGLTLIKFPPNMSISSPNYIAFRINSYFSISMRYDLSFENNTFTRLRDYINEKPNYSKIYSNSKFDLYGNP